MSQTKFVDERGSITVIPSECGSWEEAMERDFPYVTIARSQLYPNQYFFVLNNFPIAVEKRFAETYPQRVYRARLDNAKEFAKKWLSLALEPSKSK